MNLFPGQNRLFIGPVLTFLVAFLFQGWSAEPAWTQDKVRSPILAGSWYPADAGELRATIDKYLQRADLPKDLPRDGHFLGIVAPHAGIVYSGPVAAYAYRLVQDHPAEAVVILAPSHRVSFPGVSVFREGPFATPLGQVPLQADLIEALLKSCPDVRDYPPAHAREHAVEIQLPFLQTVLPSFRLVPLVFGNVSWDTCERVAQALSALSSSFRFLVVASTDLSHYHADVEARVMDARVLDRLKRLESRELWQDLSSGACEACGAGPLVTLLLYAQKRGAKNMSVLHYATSADVTGEKSRVVGYAAAAVFHDDSQKRSSMVQGPLSPSAPTLSDEHKARLKTLARDTLEAALFGKTVPDLDLSTLPKALQEPRGAFVTLKRHGQLRGCIGHIEARWPLAQTVSRMVLAAAFHDPRFPPLSSKEWNDLELEISVLSPLVKLKDPSQVQVGIHGLYMRRGSQAGLLLPQVPVEQGWNQETFLRQTCLKAGLNPEAWKEPETEIFVFTAEVF